MNTSENNKEIKFILLPSFNISSTFNSGSLGVFIGIYTGVIINLLVDNEWNFEKIVLIISSLFAVLLLIGAVKQNNIVKELCESIKLNDKNNEYKTVNSILDALWSQEDEKKNLYRKYKHRFYLCLYSSFLMILLSVAFYVYRGRVQSIEPINPKQTEIIKDTLKLQNYKQYKVNSIEKKR